MKASDILGISDLRTKQVEVPEWGVTLTVRELGLEEGLAMFAMVKEMDGDRVTLSGEDVARVVAWGVVDEAGERVFGDEDIPALARKNRRALMHLYSEITSLSGEEAEKN